jgi:glycine dehydrogenase subunit 1
MSRALHPHYRAVITTYLKSLDDMQLEEIPFDASGATDVAELTRKLDHQSMCVIVGYPNFFGIIEDLAPIQAACAGNGAQLITVTPEPLALGLLKPPGTWGADIAVGEDRVGRSDDLGWPAMVLRSEKVRP